MSEKSQDPNIERLKTQLEKTLQWGEVDSWHSKMFEELSEKVFETTGTMLSVATLKRFFGVVSHKGMPSTTTLDALSKFVGSENWRSFKMTRPVKRFKIEAPGKGMYVSVGFLLAIVVISLIGNRRPPLEINSSEFQFSSRVLSREYPNSVVFDFTIPDHIKTDSLHIQQYWDPTKTVSLEQGQTQATGIYYHPGYFKAKLMVEGQEAQSHDLFLKSNGWLGQLEYDPVPGYFQPIKDDTQLSIPKETQKEIAKREEPVVTSLHWIDDLGNVSGDNFTFNTTIVNVFDERWAVCQRMAIYFIGTDGAMIFPFSKIGCSSDLNLMLNDVYLRGKENDLSAFSADFTTPKRLSIKVREQEVFVSIEGKEVYSAAYQETMGRLVGVRFKFLGIGEVSSFELQDSADNRIPLL